MSLFGLGFGPRRRRRNPLTSRRDLTTVQPTTAVQASPPIVAPPVQGQVLTSDGTGSAVWQDPVATTTVVTPVMNPITTTTSTILTPVGTAFMWLTSTAPSGFLLLNGSTFDKNVYPKLFAVLGTTTLPDLRGKFPLGLADSGTGSTLLGTGGALDHTHSAAKHTHGIGAHTHNVPSITFNSAAASGTEVDKLSLLGILGSKASGTAHTHSVTVPARSTDASASGATAENVDGTTGAGNPAFMAVQWIVKAI